MKILDKYVESAKRFVKEFREGHTLELDSMNRIITHTPLGKIRDEITKGYDDAQKIYENTQEQRHQRKLTDFPSQRENPPASKDALQNTDKEDGAPNDTGTGKRVEWTNPNTDEKYIHTEKSDGAKHLYYGPKDSAENKVHGHAAFDERGHVLFNRNPSEARDPCDQLKEERKEQNKEEIAKEAKQPDSHAQSPEQNAERLGWMLRRDNEPPPPGGGAGAEGTSIPRNDAKLDKATSLLEKTVEPGKDENIKSEAAKSNETSSDSKEPSQIEGKQLDADAEATDQTRFNSLAQWQEQIARDTRQPTPSVAEAKPETRSWRDEFRQQPEPPVKEGGNETVAEPLPYSSDQTAPSANEAKPETRSWRDEFKQQPEPPVKERGNETVVEPLPYSSDQRSVAETRKIESASSESKSEISKNSSTGDTDRSAMNTTDSVNKETQENKASDHPADTHSDKSSHDETSHTW